MQVLIKKYLYKIKIQKIFIAFHFWIFTHYKIKYNSDLTTCEISDLKA